MELPSRSHEWKGQSGTVPRSRTNGAHSLGRRLRWQWISLKTTVFSSTNKPREAGVCQQKDDKFKNGKISGFEARNFGFQ